MRSLYAPALVLSLFLLSPITMGQEEAYGPGGGDWLISLSGTYRYSHADAAAGPQDETETLAARLSGGWYRDRTNEFGLELQPTWVRSEDSPDTTEAYLGIYYSYNYWTSPRTTFYGGPQIGLEYFEGSSSETFLAGGLHVGLRYWLNTAVSINLEPRFTIVDADDPFGGQTSNIDLFFGLSTKL